MKNNAKKGINLFILGTIAFIFSFDAIAYYVSGETISGNITEWINASYTNLIIFIGAVVTLSVHWIFGKK